MKKKIASIISGMFMLGIFAASAQTTSTTTATPCNDNQPCQTQCANQPECQPADCPEAQACPTCVCDPVANCTPEICASYNCNYENCAAQQQQCKKAGKGHHKGIHKGQGKRFNPALKGIELTDAQKQQLKDAKKEVSASFEDKKNALRQEERSAMDAKMKNILTPEQYAQYEKNITEMKNFKPGDKKFNKGGKGARDGKMQKRPANK